MRNTRGPPPSPHRMAARRNPDNRVTWRADKHQPGMVRGKPEGLPVRRLGIQHQQYAHPRGTRDRDDRCRPDSLLLVAQGHPHDPINTVVS